MHMAAIVVHSGRGCPGTPTMLPLGELGGERLRDKSGLVECQREKA